MNIVVLGSGGREHALCQKLSQGKDAEKVYCIPGNGGTKNNVDIAVNDFATIKDFCKNNDVKLIMVGPEQPLAEGIVDFFSDSDILVFGPDKDAAKLESSKIYAKRFMEKYGVSTSDFKDNPNEIEEFIDETNGNCVIKYDGLAGGKGVFVCSSVSQAKDAISQIKAKYGDDADILVETKLVGKELSVMGITDGKSIQLFMPSQDHKQLYDDDKGPNTGGMGAFTPVDFCDIELLKEITKRVVFPTLKGISQEKLNYKGVIYFGLMIQDNIPYVLEYNVRFGDPETQVILPSFKGDLLDLIMATFNGSLQDFKMDFYTDYFVNVVLASGGYPKSYKKGYEISGLDKLDKETLVYHAGTKIDNGKLVTNGGRVLSVVAHHQNLQKAIEKVYSEVAKIHFKDVYYRKDIAQRKD